MRQRNAGDLLWGLSAICPKRRLSQPAQGHRIYPYLLRGVKIVRANQVWSTDITYVRLGRGFIYLVAIIDWFSRYVLSWEVSVTVDTSFCLSALDWALASGARPEIFNSDQALNSPARISPGDSLAILSKSAWTAAAEHWHRTSN